MLYYSLHTYFSSYYFCINKDDFCELGFLC